MDIRSKLLYLFYHVVGAPFRLLPIDRNTILFEAYYGKGFQDSPSVIAARLHEDDESLKLVWLIRNKKDAESLPDYILPVKRFTLGELYLLARSKVWIDNCRKNKGLVKRKGQIYIQTWHGGLGPKLVEKDVESTLSTGYVANAIHDSEMADLFLSGSKWNTNLYHNSFWYDGEVLEAGLPRNDIFFKNPNEYRQKVRKHFSLPEDTHIALYAPTFRKNLNTDCYDLNFTALLQALETKWGGRWVVLVKMHPSATELMHSFRYTNTIVNATLYPEINELIIACDLFISDYSSGLFDAMLAKKRVIMYASDIESYVNERGFSFNLSDLPFPIVSNNEELVRIIQNYDDLKELNKNDSFLKSCGVVENGKAAETVSAWIREMIRR